MKSVKDIMEETRQQLQEQDKRLQEMELVATQAAVNTEYLACLAEING